MIGTGPNGVDGACPFCVFRGNQPAAPPWAPQRRRVVVYFGAFLRLQRRSPPVDHPGVFSIRTARSYRWRLAGGHLLTEEASLRFVPNRLERRRADTYWQCRAEEVTEVRARGKMWLVVETAAGRQSFRVFRAAAVAPRLKQALGIPL